MKNLFATHYLAGRGGWEKRQEYMPEWIAASGVKQMDQAGLDAISRATPKPGLVRLAWCMEVMKDG